MIYLKSLKSHIYTLTEKLYNYSITNNEKKSVWPFVCLIETKIKKQEEVPVSGQEGIIHVVIMILNTLLLNVKYCIYTTIFPMNYRQGAPNIFYYGLFQWVRADLHLFTVHLHLDGMVSSKRNKYLISSQPAPNVPTCHCWSVKLTPYLPVHHIVTDNPYPPPTSSGIYFS